MKTMTICGAIAAATMWIMGCSSADFSTASSDDDAGGDELGADAGAGDVALDSRSNDGADAGDVVDAAHVDSTLETDAGVVDSGTVWETSTEAGETTADDCTLSDHFDPFSGKHFSSCLPAATPCDSSSYGSALFDEEMAFVDSYVTTSMPTCTLGPSTIEIGGCDDADGAVSNCAQRILKCGESVSCLIWCYEGSLAGGFQQNASCMCVARSCDHRWY